VSSSNLYNILKISPQAGQIEIKTAYRRLVKQYHPDSQSSTADHQKIVEINAAYEILGDPQRRLEYDSKFQDRQQKAQKEYKTQRQKVKDDQWELIYWQKTIFTPIKKNTAQILESFDIQIDYLEADPYDDQLMQNFQDYLSDSQVTLDKLKLLFTSQPNPAKLAKTAASIYYCLNQIADALEELQRFSNSYDYSALHQGQEFFRLARQFLRESDQHLRYIRY
jgi:molecular chaperone DnaJ